MSEFTENNLVDEIARAAAQIEEIDMAEITARVPAPLTGEPDLAADVDARPESTTGDAANDGVVLDLTAGSHDRDRGTDKMTKRLWIIGLAAAAIVAGPLCGCAQPRYRFSDRRRQHPDDHCAGDELDQPAQGLAAPPRDLWMFTRGSSRDRSGPWPDIVDGSRRV